MLLNIPFLVLVLITQICTCSKTRNWRYLKKAFPDRVITSSSGRFTEELELEFEQIVAREGNVTSLPSQNINKNSVSYGFMSDITAIRTIALTDFYFYTNAADEVQYSLFTVPGNYALSKHSIKLWSLISYGVVKSHGKEKPTKIEKMKSISISAGFTNGFYLTLRTQNLVYLSDYNRADQTYLQNADVAISAGTGIPSYPLGDIFFEPRSWCGFIHYYVIEYPSLEPSVSPTFMPSNMPLLVESSKPSRIPSVMPSNIRSNKPSYIPTSMPSNIPSWMPTSMPSNIPSWMPTSMPSNIPSWIETIKPSHLTILSITPSHIPTSMPNYSASMTPALFHLPSKSNSTVKSSLLPTSTSTSLVTYSSIKSTQQLHTNQTITLYGSNLVLMEKFAEHALCNEVEVSLQQILMEDHDKGFKINRVFTNGQQLLGKEFNEIVVLIDAEYNSSKEIHFSTITQSSINQLRQIILINLQRDTIYFHDVERIVSLTTPYLNTDYTVSNVNLSISLQYPKGFSIETIMNPSTVIRFEDEIHNFFNQSLSSTDANSYVVMAYLTSQIFSIKNSKTYLDTWVTIHSKIIAPSRGFNVSSAIESTLNDNNQQLYLQLKDSKLPFFKKLEQVDSITSKVPPLPTLPPTIVINENLDASSTTEQIVKTFFSSTWGYVTIGIGALVFIVIAVFLSCYCRGRCCSGSGSGEERDAMEGLVIKCQLDEPTAAYSSSAPSLRGRHGYQDSFHNFADHRGRR